MQFVPRAGRILKALMPKYKPKSVKRTNRTLNRVMRSVVKNSVVPSVSKMKHYSNHQNYLSFMKDSRVERLKYLSSSTITCPSGDKIYAQSFNMISIYNPDQTGDTKDKPVEGYTLLSTLYKKYQVYGFKVKVTCINNSSYPVMVVFGGVQSSSWVADWAVTRLPTDIASRVGIKNMILSPTGGSADVQTRTYTCLPREIIGVSKANWNGDDTFGASFGASPIPDDGVTPYFAIAHGCAQEGLSQPVSVTYIMNFEFFTKLYNPVDNTDQ